MPFWGFPRDMRALEMFLPVWSIVSPSLGREGAEWTLGPDSDSQRVEKLKQEAPPSLLPTSDNSGGPWHTLHTVLKNHTCIEVCGRRTRDLPSRCPWQKLRVLQKGCEVELMQTTKGRSGSGLYYLFVGHHGNSHTLHQRGNI